MSYLERLKSEFSENPLPGVLTKLTKAPSVSSVSDPSRRIRGKTAPAVFEYRLHGETGPLVLICPPGSDLDHARRRLAYQFGADRVIEVRDRRSRD